jgi:hypothetical protein
MQNRDNSPYDDIFANLSKIVEEIARNMPEHQNTRIVGYTIITRGQGETPCVFRVGDDGQEDAGIPYEVVESGDMIYITAELPPGIRYAPYADIRIDSVRICVDDFETIIDIDQAIDVIHSHYRVHRGIMDIAIRKIPHPQ